jgi:hypothetical protein
MLIIAISDASDNISNSVALMHAKEVDPELLSTIGFISKLDKIREEDEDKLSSVLRVLENKTFPLSKGYVGVINANPSQVI